MSSLLLFVHLLLRMRAHQFGGNAQAITKGRWLHHTSFLWDFDPTNMLYLQMPEKRVRGRRGTLTDLHTSVPPNFRFFFGGR